MGQPAAPALVAAALLGLLVRADAASAQEVGRLTALCQIGGGQAQLNVQVTTYRDAVAWVDEFGLNQGATDMGANIVYWEGQLNTAQFGSYRIEGRNGIIEAYPYHGHYSDMLVLYVENTGPNTFVLRDESNTRHPCQRY